MFWLMPFMKIKIRIGIALLFMLFIKNIYANNIEILQNKLNILQSMSANFTQVIYVKERAVSKSYGNMALQRPLYFRWNTQKPLIQSIIADGKNIWIYDQDLEQVTVQKQKARGTMLLFLSGNKNVMMRDFTVTIDTVDTTDTMQIFTLQAKNRNENFDKIKLIFNKIALVQIEFFDKLSQHTVIKLTKIDLNNKLTRNLFIFKPPRGVDIIQQ